MSIHFEALGIAFVLPPQGRISIQAAAHQPHNVEHSVLTPGMAMLPPPPDPMIPPK